METLGSLLEAGARLVPEKIYVRMGDQTISYGEFNRQVNRLANCLHQLGVEKDSHVAALLPNSLDFLFLYFAVAKLGAVNVFINTQYDSKLLKHALDSTDSQTVIVDQKYLQRYGDIRQELKKVRLNIVRGPNGSWPGSIPLQDLYSGSSVSPPTVSISSGDPVQLIFTSGSTGLPKPCILSHARWIAICANINRHLEASPEDTFFCLLPNYHGNVYGGIFGALLARASFALEEQFSASLYWDQVRGYGATILILHITPMNILLQKKANEKEDQKHPARAATFIVGNRAREFLKRFGISKGLAAYGTTEAGGLCAMKARGPEDDLPSNFCGMEREDMEMRVVNQEDEEVPWGQVGEMVVRPRKPFVIFNGYYGMPDKTLEGCRNLWLHTGDLGYRDEKGNYFYVGRKDESIRVKGEFVMVEYVESILRTHPSIAECALVGLPSEIGEQDIKAYIKLNDRASLRYEDVIFFCREKLPEFMVPRWLEFLDAFPMLSSAMKIDKRNLKNRGIHQAWDRNSQEKSKK